MDIITTATDQQITEAAATVGHTVTIDGRLPGRFGEGKAFSVYVTTEGLRRSEQRKAEPEVLAAIAAVDADAQVYSRDSAADGGPAFLPATQA